MGRRRQAPRPQIAIGRPASPRRLALPSSQQSPCPVVAPPHTAPKDRKPQAAFFERPGARSLLFLHTCDRQATSWPQCSSPYAAEPNGGRNCRFSEPDALRMLQRRIEQSQGPEPLAGGQQAYGTSSKVRVSQSPASARAGPGPDVLLPAAAAFAFASAKSRMKRNAVVSSSLGSASTILTRDADDLCSSQCRHAGSKRSRKSGCGAIARIGARSRATARNCRSHRP